MLLAVLLAWTTFGLGGYVPETKVVSSALVGVLAVVHLLERAFRRVALPRARPAGWLLLPFVVYAAANVWWVSPVKWLGWFDWFGWAAMLAVFWVTLNGVRSAAPRKLIFLTVVAVALASVTLACYQRFVNPEWLMLGRVQARQFVGRASGPFGIPNSLAALLMLVLPAVAALATRRRALATGRVWWGWVAAVLAFGLVLPISRGAWIGLALALTTWPLMAARGGLRRRALLAGGALLLVLVASAVVLATAPKVRFRFAQMIEQSGELSRPILWRAGWRMFQEAPVFGSGAGSYNVRFEQHRPEGFLLEPEWAHNDYLNTLSDYGIVGAMLLLGGALVITARCLRSCGAAAETDEWIDDPATVGGLSIGLLAFALQLFVDFHLKIPALAMSFAALAGLVVSACRPVQPGEAVPSRSTRAISFLSAGLVLLLVALVFTPAFRAEALRYRARRAIDGLANVRSTDPVYGARIADARNDLAKAVSITAWHAQAWADLSYASALLAGVDPTRGQQWADAAEDAAQRALALSDAPYEFWLRRGIARDLQGRWLEAGGDFAEALARAPNNSAAWYYQAEHFSRKSTELKLAEAALAFCLRLDPTNTPAIALRQRLAISGKVP